MATLDLVYTELRREIGRYLGYGRDPSAFGADEATDVDDAIRSGLRNFYFHPNVGISHTWTFLYPSAVLETSPPYSTGTVTIVADASGSIVTLADGTWPDDVGEGWRLRVDGDTYEVASRTSDTVIILDDDDVTAAAGSTFSLGQNRFELPADFVSFSAPLTYQPGTGNFYRSIDMIDDHLLREWEQHHEWNHRPFMGALIPKAVPTDGSETQRWYLRLAPTPDAEYRFFYRYLHNPEMLDATNVHHWGAVPHSETILLSCLASAERMLNDGSVQMHQRFLEALQASVQFDRASNAPDHLGQCYDPLEVPIDTTHYPTREQLVDWRWDVPTVESL